MRQKGGIMAKTARINYKTAEANNVRNACALFVVSKDVLEVSLCDLDKAIKAIKGCIETDLADLDRIEEGHATGRPKEKIEESLETLRKNLAAKLAERTEVQKTHTKAIAPAYAMLRVTTDCINSKGETATPGTRGAHDVSGIFGGYQRSIKTGNPMWYRKAICDLLMTNGVVPTDAGVAELMTVGGVKANRGKAYLKTAIEGDRKFTKASYPVSASGEERFLYDFLSKMCDQAGDALPVRKLEYELTGKKTIKTK